MPKWPYKAYIVTDYYKYGSLHSVLRRKKLTFRQAIKLMLSLASGIAYLHENVVCVGSGIKSYLNFVFFISYMYLSTLSNTNDAVLNNFGNWTYVYRWLIKLSFWSYLALKKQSKETNTLVCVLWTVVLLHFKYILFKVLIDVVVTYSLMQ